MEKYRVVVRYTPHTRFFEPEERAFEVNRMSEIEKLCYDIWGDAAWAKTPSSRGGCSVISVTKVEA